MSDIEPISYDFSAVMIDGFGLFPSDLAELGPRLDAARQEVLADAELCRQGGPVPPEKQPLDAGFVWLPDRLLTEYRHSRPTSELGRILAAAKRIRDSVDRCVVLGIGGSYMGARALFESCCHPYFNELSRGERGGRPRLYFAGENVDNDATQGLLDVLGAKEAARDLEHRFALIAISKSGGTLETAVALRLFLDPLQRQCGGDSTQIGEWLVPITGAGGRLFELAKALSCRDIFHIPEGVGGRFSIFTAVGLLPAAILGIDIVKLLEGAAAMNARFTAEAPQQNIVLNYAGVCHLLEELRGANIRVLATWARGLEAAGLWHDQLLSESLGKQGRGATPLTVVNTRDLHSRGQQHQEGRRDKLITNVIVEQVRRDRLSVQRSDRDEDQLNELTGKTLPEIMAAAIAGTNRAYRDDHRPTADLRLPRLDEASMGQFFQMMMLATAVEGRLIGMNPFGQPGVESYKKHMNAFLRET